MNGDASREDRRQGLCGIYCEVSWRTPSIVLGPQEILMGPKVIGSSGGRSGSSSSSGGSGGEIVNFAISPRGAHGVLETP